MARIGIDIDGVCYDFIDALRLYINESSGKPLEEMPEAQVWDFFEEQWGINANRYIKFVVDGVLDGKIFWQGKIYPGCLEVIRTLKQMGHEIIFITARKFHTIEAICALATISWIEQNNLPYDKIIVSNDKTGYDLDLLIDDSPNQIENHVLHGEHAVIFDQPWNQDIKYCDRVYGWNDVLKYVENYFQKVSM
jgi:hypothetical protein